MSRTILTIDGAVVYDSGEVAPAPPNPLPTVPPVVVPTPPTHGTPEQFEVKRITWGPGNSYTTVGAPLVNQDPNKVFCWKLPVSALLTGNTGQMQMYQSSDCLVSISSVPGTFYDKPGMLKPQMSVVSNKQGMLLAAFNHPASDATLAASGYTRLPNHVDGFYYINVGVLQPQTQNITYFLLYGT
jgi:hypothetical protein